MKSFLNGVIKKAQQAKCVIIVGAGTRGKILLMHFENYDSIIVKAFFDNNDVITGKFINNIEIKKPYKLDESGVLYIVAVGSMDKQKELKLQLHELEINDNDVLIYSSYQDYDYLSNLDEKDYEMAVKAMYYEKFGKEINWKNPETYNEKINWEKINAQDEFKTKLADKVLVRDWIKEQIGERYLTKLYGVWDSADRIDFHTLPSAFVLKLNNGSGRNIIVKDKDRINKEEICRQLTEWKKINYAYNSLELQYKNISPQIICEEYLEGVAESVYDYNIYCFHGEPEYIWCIKGSHRPECKASFYNKNWEMMPFSYGYPKDNEIAPRPNKLEEMLRLSRILSKGFKHVRVDWYNLPDGRVLFGEMTFSTWGGLQRFEPKEYDLIFGKLI